MTEPSEEPSTEVEVVHQVGVLAARGPLAQIQAVLLDAMLKMPEADTPEAAELWRGADILAKDLAAVRREAANRLIELAPRETYKSKGVVRERPVKTQVIPEVGVIAIENAATRIWKDKRELAHSMLAEWVNNFARTNDGALPSTRMVLDWVFDIFQVGDPRTTVMKERGLGTFDDPDNGWVGKTYRQTARVL